MQFEKLSKSNAIYNLNNAFNVAEDKLQLTKLLDAEGECSHLSVLVTQDILLENYSNESSRVYSHDSKRLEREEILHLGTYLGFRAC